MLKEILGRCDIVDFPLFGLKDVKVKVDTGAYSSSFSAYNIRIENNLLYFNLLYLGEEKTYIFEKYSTTEVKSSNGIVELRYVIETDIKIFDIIYPIEMTLTDRTKMNFPVLLGRKFLNKKFIIDTSLINISYKKKIKNENSNII